MGNTFFFMSSGFLVTHGYQNRIADKTINFTDYMIRRIIKLYPLYILTNMLRLFLNIISNGTAAIKFDDLIYVFFMTASGWVSTTQPYNDPTWFVCVLLLCYIAYYFVAKVKSKSSDIYILLIIVFICLGRTLQTIGAKLPFLRAGNGQAYFCFFVGAALYHLVSSGYNNLIRMLRLIGGIVLVSFLVLSKKEGIETAAADVPFVFSAMLMPMVIIYSINIKCIANYLSIHPLIYLGKISMSVFYFHTPLLILFKMIRNTSNIGNISMQQQYMIWFGILIMVSALSYHFFEPALTVFFEKCFFRIENK